MFVVLQVSAQKIESVYSVTKVVEETSWHETQSKLWKEAIDADDSNGEAWYNYYMANRGLRNISLDFVVRTPLSFMNNQRLKSNTQTLLRLKQTIFSDTPKGPEPVFPTDFFPFLIRSSIV